MRFKLPLLCLSALAAFSISGIASATLIPGLIPVALTISQIDIDKINVKFFLDSAQTETFFKISWIKVNPDHSTTTLASNISVAYSTDCQGNFNTPKYGSAGDTVYMVMFPCDSSGCMFPAATSNQITLK